MAAKFIVPFLWVDFCETYNIPMKTRGKSTHRGFVYVSCPWCGSQKQLLGLSQNSTFYGCWKDSWHRGHNPVRLVRAILDVSWHEAQQIASRYAPNGLDFYIHVPEKSSTPEEYEPPASLRTKFPFAAREYVEDRGIKLEDFKRLGGAFGGIRPDDDFCWRVVLPISLPNGKVVGATGRCVGEGVSPPYHTLPPNLDAGLLGPHWCRESSWILVVVEGPFDAIKLQVAAEFYGLPIDTVALLGVAPSKIRHQNVRELSVRYEHVAWMMDRKEYSTSLKYSNQMRMPSTAHMGTTKDPGALSVEDAKLVLDEILACATALQEAAA